MSFTYAQLRQAVQDYVETSETKFVSNLPLFIRLAEERILKNVRLNLFQKTGTLTLTAGDPELPLPADFLSPISLSVTGLDGEEFLLFKDLDFVQTFAPDPAETGVPRFFGTLDVATVYLAPTPDAAYTATLNYFYRPDSLTSKPDSGTTWLSQNASLSMLYGTLFEAYTFLKGDEDLMQLYAARFQESLMRLKDLGEGKETVTEYRYGKVRVPRS
jgi:hypothetical protein